MIKISSIQYEDMVKTAFLDEMEKLSWPSIGPMGGKVVRWASKNTPKIVKDTTRGAVDAIAVRPYNNLSTAKKIFQKGNISGAVKHVGGTVLDFAISTPATAAMGLVQRNRLAMMKRTPGMNPDVINSFQKNMIGDKEYKGALGLVGKYAIAPAVIATKPLVHSAAMIPHQIHSLASQTIEGVQSLGQHFSQYIDPMHNAMKATGLF